MSVKRVITPEQIRKVQDLVTAQNFSKKEACDTVGISVSSFYRGTRDVTSITPTTPTTVSTASTVVVKPRRKYRRKAVRTARSVTSTTPTVIGRKPGRPAFHAKVASTTAVIATQKATTKNQVAVIFCDASQVKSLIQEFQG